MALYVAIESTRAYDELVSEGQDGQTTQKSRRGGQHSSSFGHFKTWRDSRCRNDTCSRHSHARCPISTTRLRVIIEGKFADHPSAEAVVLEDAPKRVKSGLAHIAAAAIYPTQLRTTPTVKLLDELTRATLKYRIVAETHESEEWFEGTPASLMDALRRAQEALTQDDIVERTAKSLSVQLEGVSRLWMGQAGACDRLSQILGITPPKGEVADKAEARRETAAKVSALVLANAYIFQEQLATSDGRIVQLRKLEKEKNLVEATATHWTWISEEINYVPIFQLGERVLQELPASRNTTIAVKSLLAEAKNICNQQAALRHDLMGRIYHWLLHHAKYLGTYYTSTSSATLLLKLTLAADWGIDFSDPRQLATFKVADLACGTGTLLMAAAQAFSDIYIRSMAAKGRALDIAALSTLHKALWKICYMATMFCYPPCISLLRH